MFDRQVWYIEVLNDDAENKPWDWGRNIDACWGEEKIWPGRDKWKFVFTLDDDAADGEMS